ncbi:MAG: hypothetical protein LH481_09930 [Burkholderiales bacterium]|nr:hypothetical protein [Burkholderiales bacterium]
MNTSTNLSDGQAAFPHGFVVLCVALAFCLPGLVGHQPWKPDEGYIFAGIFHMLQSGDWIVPHLAGEPFMEKPPLYHWVAAVTATLTSSILPLHDGARLASGVFIGMALWATALAGRIAWGVGHGRIALLIMLGTLGLLNTVPLMLPDLPLTAGFAVAMLGFVAHAFERKWAFAAVGIGVGMGFLAKGLLAPGAIALAALTLPICFAQWRDRRYLRMLLLALLVALPCLVIWPTLLYVRDPVSFVTWVWDNNIGRFFGFSVDLLGAASERGFWTKAFPWFLFPWWIFLGIGLWNTRARILRDTGMQVGLAVALTLTFVLVIAGSARVIYALPLLPALALASTGVLNHVPMRLWHILGAMGAVIALLMASLSWYLWSALTSSGQAPEWQWIMRNVPLTFDLPVSLPVVAVAALLSAGWVAILFFCRRIAQGSLLLWTASMAISWALPMLLLLPWLDVAKGYQDVYAALARTLPSRYSCIQSEQFGESERGILQYTQGIVTVRKEVAPLANCPFMLRQLRTTTAVSAPKGDWTLLWRGSRPSSGNERFELFASQSLEEGRRHTAILQKSTVAQQILQPIPRTTWPPRKRFQ